MFDAAPVQVEPCIGIGWFDSLSCHCHSGETQMGKVQFAAMTERFKPGSPERF